MYPNPKPKPPLPGGEYTHVSDPGTPPLPPGVKTVNLIPIGDGGPGTPLPPARPRRKPLLPTADELARLPRSARAAFASRCVERSLPALRRFDPLIADGLIAAEREAVLAADDPRVAADVALRAAEMILRVASDPRDLLSLRSDFEWARELVEENGWTDDTPVPPDALGPLWPPGRVPEWARDAKRPRG
jgi:hypothetical protein